MADSFPKALKLDPVRNHQSKTAWDLSPVSPHESVGPISKAAQKNEKAYNKLLLQEAKGDGKKLKEAIKDGDKANRVEQKASKQATKAKKSLEKAIAKEHKLNMKLVAAKAGHDKSVSDLEEAKSKAIVKQTYHRDQARIRDYKMEVLKTVRGRGPVIA